METTADLNFRCRIRSRAIVAGVFSSLALIIVFMSLAAGFGLWNFDLHGYQLMYPGIWLFTYAATAVSLYVGAFVAAQSGRSILPRDGTLHGFVTWAVANVLVSLFIFTVLGNFLFLDLAQSAYMAAFLAEFIALAAALSGGVSGAKMEQAFEAKEMEASRILEKRRLNEAYT